MLDEYYMELVPKRRKKILEEGLEDATLDQAEQIKKLFELRYSQDKKGEYIDNFLAQWLEIIAIGGNLNSYFSKKSNTKRALAAVHKLCLDRTDEFEEEILYREMRNMALVYEHACNGDSSYRAFIVGMGKISNKKYLEKMRRDFRRVGVTVPEALGLQEEFAILSKALEDCAYVYEEE